VRKPVEETATEIVNGLSFSSNRMVKGRMIGEQHFAYDAIVAALKDERERYDTIKGALCQAISTLNGVKAGRLVHNGKSVRKSFARAMEALEQGERKP